MLHSESVVCLFCYHFICLSVRTEVSWFVAQCSYGGIVAKQVERSTCHLAYPYVLGLTCVGILHSFNFYNHGQSQNY